VVLTAVFDMNPDDFKFLEIIQLLFGNGAYTVRYSGQ